MEPTSTIALLLITILSVYFYVKWLYSYWQRHNIPYITPTFPYGNLSGFRDHKQIALLLDEWYQQLKGCGPIGGIYLMHKPFAIAMDPEFIKQMLIKDFGHFEDRGFFHNEKDDPFSANLFAIEPTRWRAVRAKLTPTFTSGKMKYMFSEMVTIAKQLENYLSGQISAGDQGTDLQIGHAMSLFTIDVIGSCAFGIDCNSFTNPNTDFKSMGQKAFGGRKFHPAIVFLLSCYPKTIRRLGFQLYPKELREFYARVVNDTVRYRESNKITRGDFLDLLLKLKRDEDADRVDGSLTLHQIVVHCFTFFVAGFDTSSTTLMYALYELAKHPDVQQKLRTEMKTVLAKHNDRMTYEAITSMPYLDQVINETLRMHPVVGQLVRSVTKDYQIPGTTHILRKGLRILVPTYSLHHDPDLFPNPDEFLLERFSSMCDDELRSEYINFLGFGHGPRNCIGIRFAMMQLRVGLVTLLANYTISVCDKTVKRFEYSTSNILMVPNEGVWLNVKKNVCND